MHICMLSISICISCMNHSCLLSLYACVYVNTCMTHKCVKVRGQSQFETGFLLPPILPQECWNYRHLQIHQDLYRLWAFEPRSSDLCGNNFINWIISVDKKILLYKYMTVCHIGDHIYFSYHRHMCYKCHYNIDVFVWELCITVIWIGI